MIDFYKRYVDPSSAQGAKLLVNINSQVKSAAKTNANPLSTVDNPATSDEDIKAHLQLKLKVDETELEDAVELWREICRQNTEKTEANEAEKSGVINIDDVDAFKADHDALSPPSLDLSRFEWHG